MSGALHHRIRHSQEVLHSAWYGVLLSSLVPWLVFVTVLVVSLLLFSRAS